MRSRTERRRPKDPGGGDEPSCSDRLVAAGSALTDEGSTNPAPAIILEADLWEPTGSAGSKWLQAEELFHICATCPM